ncbi:MAG TPA: A/G-specific adenine glycosylase [Candidatus Paceibacterota bacterium]|nr:A/G-specific adenine glycosylase [Candidatus Paceibacterota bacterium]
MLQQTGVERVVQKYRAFLKRFPTIRALARVPLKEVLKEWQGLGYNRRAKLLRDAAKLLVEQYGGKFPKNEQFLEGLPGIGPYTARAVMAFAFNKPVVFIETNIRTVFLHHFFKNRTTVSDSEILPYMVKMLDKKNPRKWYSALMDYGASLKKFGVRLNAKSAHYTKQSKFEGSIRQLRGRILKMALEKGKVNIKKLAKEMKKPPAQVRAATGVLRREGLLE